MKRGQYPGAVQQVFGGTYPRRTRDSGATDYGGVPVASYLWAGHLEILERD
jgi:hypothetical protein